MDREDGIKFGQSYLREFDPLSQKKMIVESNVIAPNFWIRRFIRIHS